MDIKKFLKDRENRPFQMPKRTKVELDTIAYLFGKKQLGKLTDSEKSEFYELCYHRDPVFPKKDIEQIKAKYGEAAAEIEED
jgi:succinate dehydrogenase flavin-adding protein (antitoxin of CptAB toxin-antitoxin module)